MHSITHSYLFPHSHPFVKVGTDMAPVPQAHFGPSLFFFVFITIQVFLVVPLFVCVVVDTFFEGPFPAIVSLSCGGGLHVTLHR